jgi:hypothetical protein
MPKKKANEATVAPAPVSDASVPVAKKARKKEIVASAAEKTTNPPALGRTTSPQTISETPNGSIAYLAGALESPSALTAREIEERAYQSWIERGCPMGSPEEDWYRAERELIARFATASK